MYKVREWERERLCWSERVRKRETMLKWESEKERDYAEVREWERERLCWSERVRKRETMLKSKAKLKRRNEK